MTTPSGEHSTDAPASFVQKPGGQRWLSILRLLIAVGITSPACLYCWIVLFVRAKGIPLREAAWVWVLGLCIGVPVVLLLKWGQVQNPARRKWWGAAGLLAWLGVLSVFIIRFTGDLMPKWELILVMALASLWIPWLEWMSYLTPRKKLRGAGLVFLGLCGVILPSLLRLDGLTGDARANFSWSFSKDGPPGTAAAVPTPKNATLAKPSADFAHVSPRDFPEFLANRRGVLTNLILDSDWTANPPQELWRKPVGKSWSSFAVVGDYAVTMEQRDNDEAIACYRVSTGEEMWAQLTPAVFQSVMGGDGPRATPTIHEGRVYAVGATGKLHCLDGGGNVIWQVDLFAETGGNGIAHGMCGSPLIVDDLVFVSVTGKAGISPVAYSKADGKRRWAAGKWPASYSSPQLAVLNNVRQILMFNSQGIEAFTPKDGKPLWSFPWTNTEKTIASQPVLIPGNDKQVLLSIGYSNGAVLLEVTPDKDPQSPWNVKELWKSKDMKTKFTTAVVYQDHLYGLDDGILACARLKDGKRQWKQGRYQHGQLLLVNDLLLIQAENGEVCLVKADPKKHQELGKIPALEGKTWNNPALAGEFLLVRNDHEAACYRLPLKSKSSP
ncbi:MAG: PQQ-binding-like beta-propeller repeat protein [Planctomycetales bacterium]